MDPPGSHSRSPCPSALPSACRRQDALRRVWGNLENSVASLVSSSGTTTLPSIDKVQTSEQPGGQNERQGQDTGKEGPLPARGLSSCSPTWIRIAGNSSRPGNHCHILINSPRKAPGHLHSRPFFGNDPQLTCCAGHTSHSEGPPSSDIPHRSYTAHRIPRGPW